MTNILFWTLIIYAVGMTLAFVVALNRLEVERNRHRWTKWLLDHGCKEERRCGKVMKKTSNSKSKHIVTRKPTGEIWGGYSARPTGKGPGKPPKGGTGKTGKGSGNEQGALKYGERNCEKGIPIGDKEGTHE